MSTELEVETLLAKQAIRDVLSRYCRGLDRMDKPMSYSVFHENATAHYYDIYEGTGHGFIDWVWKSHENMRSHSHQINNVLIEVDGDSAVSEAYVTVLLQMREDLAKKPTEITARGRYLDKWKKVNGTWAITERIHVIDAQAMYFPDSISKSEESRRDEQDPSYQFLKA